MAAFPDEILLKFITRPGILAAFRSTCKAFSKVTGEWRINVNYTCSAVETAGGIFMYKAQGKLDSFPKFAAAHSIISGGGDNKIVGCYVVGTTSKSIHELGEIVKVYGASVKAVNRTQSSIEIICRDINECSEKLDELRDRIKSRYNGIDAGIYSMTAYVPAHLLVDV